MLTIISHPVGQKNKHFDQNKSVPPFYFLAVLISFKSNLKSSNAIN